MNPLAIKLKRLFETAALERREVEERWLRDLRQYKGVYDPEVGARISPRRSRAFIRLTRDKVRAVDARLLDLLFPGDGEPNWSIRPTAAPALCPVTEAGLLEELSRELGREPAAEELERSGRARAERACEAMRREMADQLEECRYREIVRDVIHSGNLYGVGVLKGPLVERRKARRWELDEANGSSKGKWRLAETDILRPFVEFAPVWDLYPDMSVRDPEKARFIFQRHVMDRLEIVRLAARPDFDGQALLDAVSAPRDASPAPRRGFEAELADMGGVAAAATTRDDHRTRWEVLEFWGRLNGRELAEAGLEIPEGRLDADLPVNAWLVGETLVKLSLCPLPGVERPYWFYSFDKDETGVFCEGLASVMRDPQQLFNASVRALLDNAAICAGPQIEVNLDLLPENEDPTDVHPFRVWLRNGAGAEADSPAVRVFSLPSHADQFMAMAEMFARLTRETTQTPGLSQAENEIGAASTARGLSMLLASAAVTLKDQVRLFDEGVTRPFITALYHWNMRFNPKPGIKGDFEVAARGFSGLVAREVHVDQLDRFAASVLNDLDAPLVDRRELLKRRALAHGLGTGIVLEAPGANNSEARP